MNDPRLDRQEQRLQKRRERQQQTGQQILHAQPEVIERSVPVRVQYLQKAWPVELVREGRIEVLQGEPQRARYDLALFAENPQHPRVIDENIEVLQDSLREEGQKEPVLARLLTELDRQRWGEDLSSDCILVLLDGRRRYRAAKGAGLEQLLTELILPEEGEEEVDYVRRCLRRVAIEMMHSQAWTILDKVNMCLIWGKEHGIEQLKTADIIASLGASKTEASFITTVAYKLHPPVRDRILSLPAPPADEVIYKIARRPAPEQMATFQHYHRLSAAAVRRIESAQQKQLAAPRAGHPGNYTLQIDSKDAPFLSIATSLTAKQWKKRGGSKAFWDSLRTLLEEQSIQQQVDQDLEV